MNSTKSRHPLNALFITGLGLVMVAMFGWGVIGKHRFDPEARTFYKATRAVTPQHSYELPAAAVASIRVDVLPPIDGRWVLVFELRQAVPARERARYSPSRSPPFA